MRRVLTLCLITALAAFAAPEKSTQKPSDGYFVASDGVKIHYLTLGKTGTPVVLIHGYTGSAEGNWFSNGIAQALAKNHRVAAIDCRGHGLSDKPYDPDKYGADRMPRDVIEMMDHLSMPKAHIHGYSMGGAITGQLLAHHPERFFTAAFGGSGIRETDPEWVAKVPKDEPGPDPLEAEASKKLVAAPNRDQKALDVIRQGMQARGQQAAVNRIDLTTISFPVLAINGEFDSPNAKTVRMQREIKHFKSVVLPGKSHLTAIMAGYMPEAYVTALVDFINANDAPL